MRSGALAISILMVALSLAGCFGETGKGLQGQESTNPSPGPANITRVKGVVPITSPEPAIDRRFGDDRPLTLADIPSLLPKTALTDYNTTRDYLLTMVAHPAVTLFDVGITLENRVIFGVLLSDDGEFHPDRPTLHLTCSQHGNEPSGSEACLIFIEYFVHGTDTLAQDVRTKLNIVMLPLANPDGKEAASRVNHDGIDINRDHMDMVTLEGQAIHHLYNLYDPEVALDLHEFGGSGINNPLPPGVPVSTYSHFEVASPQTAYNNDEEMLSVNYDLEARIIKQMWDRFGVGGGGHYKSTNFVSSIQRNHYGMHNSISLLFETGGGTNLANIDLRTDLHIQATFLVIRWMLEDPAAVLALEARADARAHTHMPGAQGWLVTNQTDSRKLESLLKIHNISYSWLAADASFLVNDYRAGAGSVPQTKNFPKGTLFVDRYQNDGRVAYEIFEATHDDYYDHGPRDWGLDVYRIIGV
jgi:hypothetical protein